MEKISFVQSRVVPLDRANIDTDQIIPKQFLRAISRLGFGQFLFDEWRYADHGELGMDCEQRPKNMDFALNQPQFAGAQILLTQDNFGCGSSREHAVWALMEFGFRAIVAPSFGDIFRNNAYKNGLLPVPCDKAVVGALMARAQAGGLTLRIDLAAQTLAVVEDESDSESAAKESWHFDIEATHKHNLLEGLDDIARTLQSAAAIRAYEQQRKTQEPWLFEKSQQ